MLTEIDVLQAGKRIGVLMVSEAQWQFINYVDYIELDFTGQIVPEFVAAHGPNVCQRMTRLLLGAEFKTVQA